MNTLRAQLEQFSASESARNKALKEENQKLRSRLQICQNRLKSHQATLAQIVDSLSDESSALSPVPSSQDVHPPSSEADTMALDLSPTTSPSMLPLDPSVVDFPPLDANHDSSDQNLVEVFEDSHPPQIDNLNIPSLTTNPDQSILDQLTTTPLPWSLPNEGEYNTDISISVRNKKSHLPQSLDHAQSMGLTKHFASSAHMLPLLKSVRATPLSPVSKYSDHINAYEFCVVTRYLNNQVTLDCDRYGQFSLPETLSRFQTLVAILKSANRHSLFEIISSMIATFSDLYWHSMGPWLKHTDGNAALSRLTAWRLAPSTETYTAIPACLRPTPLQIAVPHPAVIDWCIFPFLRDKMIQYHSSDPALDQICGDIGEAYVVQADLSDLVVDAGPLAVNFSVLDVIYAYESSTEWSPTSDHDHDDHSYHSSSSATSAKGARPQPTHKTLPAPNLHALLHSREYIAALYSHLNFRQPGDHFLLDKSLFVKYPHLYEPSPLIDQSLPLRSANGVKWGHPLPLDSIALSCYQNAGLHRSGASRGIRV